MQAVDAVAYELIALMALLLAGLLAVLLRQQRHYTRQLQKDLEPSSGTTDIDQGSTAGTPRRPNAP